MENFGGPVGQKYAKINLSGKDALREGAVSRFEGFGESLKNRFGVVLEFKPESQKELAERITKPLESIEAQLGLTFMLAGRDFPLHATIEEGLYQGDDASARDALFKELATDPMLTEVMKTLEGSVLFKYLLLDKGNVLLTSTEIPDAVKKAREHLTALYAAHAMKPLVMENILHISVARMTQLPETQKEEIFKKYAEQMMLLRRAISKNPITLAVGRVNTGSSYNFLNNVQGSPF